MLDEYKEDFGTGIDDLEFDTPQNNYSEDIPSSAQNELQRGHNAVPPAQPETYYEPQSMRAPIPAFQGAAPHGDAVTYEQPHYVGQNAPSIGEILRAKEPRLGCLRTIALGGISLAVIALSFWGSFILGQKIFMPPVKEQFLKNKKDRLPDFLNPSTRKLAPLTIPAEVTIPKKPGKIFVRSTGLKPKSTIKPAANKYTPAKRTIYRIIAGSFASKQNAALTQQQLKEDGFDTFIKQVGGKYQVQIGAFSQKNSAQRLLERALSFGYEAAIVN